MTREHNRAVQSKVRMVRLGKFGRVKVALLVGVAGFYSFAASAHGPEVGKAAPSLNLSKVLQAPAGTHADLDALQGNVVVLDFWATWCGPCRESIPHWNQLAHSFKDKPVRFLAITDENEQVVATFLKRTPIHSWIGLDGLGQSTRDAYHIEGIPTTVIVNQKGVVVAVTHPIRLEPKHIEEVIETGNSSLPLPVEPVASGDSGDAVEQVSSTQSVFEVSVRRSRPRPAGHGFNCWEGSESGTEVAGQYATVKSAILTLFDGRESLLDCRADLPTGEYDFTVRVPVANHTEREQALAPLFRTAFGLRIWREKAEREVYVLEVASTNAPGLTLSTLNSNGGGGEQRGALKLGRTKVAGLPAYLEKWLGKPVVDESGLTNRYDIRLKWKMSKRELLLNAFDRQVLEALEEPDTTNKEKLSADPRRQLTAIQGKLPEVEFRKFSAEDRENIELFRAEMTKPDDQRFEPEPSTILTAVREQLGLNLSLQRRSMPILIVEKADPSK
jgi:uncharacterized protein (TIGR03435 family)